MLNKFNSRFNSTTIHKNLLKMGINLDIPMKSRESCLMLYIFDDSTLHFKSPLEFIKDIKSNPNCAKA